MGFKRFLEEPLAKLDPRFSLNLINKRAHEANSIKARGDIEDDLDEEKMEEDSGTTASGNVPSGSVVGGTSTENIAVFKDRIGSLVKRKKKKRKTYKDSTLGRDDA